MADDKNSVVCARFVCDIERPFCSSLFSGSSREVKYIIYIEKAKRHSFRKINQQQLQTVVYGDKAYRYQNNNIVMITSS